MEKRKLSGKTILKLAGALLALAYLGFYFYVGITGKLPYMHETVHIMRYGDRKKWVARWYDSSHDSWYMYQLCA